MLGCPTRWEPAAALPQELGRHPRALVACLPPSRPGHVCPVLRSGFFQTSVGASHWSELHAPRLPIVFLTEYIAKARVHTIGRRRLLSYAGALAHILNRTLVALAHFTKRALHLSQHAPFSKSFFPTEKNCRMRVSPHRIRSWSSHEHMHTGITATSLKEHTYRKKNPHMVNNIPMVG